MTIPASPLATIASSDQRARADVAGALVRPPRAATDGRPQQAPDTAELHVELERPAGDTPARAGRGADGGLERMAHQIRELGRAMHDHRDTDRVRRHLAALVTALDDLRHRLAATVEP